MVQVHLLTSYPAALLNRDDAGLAKRMPFGGAVRTRISSQCLKKHWREATPLNDDETMAVRSRLIFERHVAEPLRGPELGLTDAEVATLTQLLVETVLAQKKGDAEEGGDADGSDDAEGQDAKPAQAKQVMVLSRPECEWLTDTAKEIVRLARDCGVPLDDATALRDALGAGRGGKSAKPKKGRAKDDASPAARTEVLAELWRERLATIVALPASVDVALFGRFVTSDLLARVDAAVSVAHAITTHAELAETDYFTAVDMLDTSSAGAGHLNDTELTSGVFYTYAVVDLDQLRANLGPYADRAEALAARLVRTMATVGPRAKRGSTAPYAVAEFVLLERGPEQPRTLANAFRTPVAARPAEEDLMARSIRALLEHRRRLGAMYGELPEALAATIHEEAAGDAVALAPLADAIATAFGLGVAAPHYSPTRNTPGLAPAAGA
jgi:CRISPR system Cascade subunit CasC